MEDNKVIYKCQDCDKKFETYQGSRRKYCRDCTTDRQGARRKKAKR